MSSSASNWQEIARSGRCDLSRSGLTALPPEVCQLRDLETLVLTGNEITELPPEICQLANLRELWLNDNKLTTIPSQIGQLANLRTLVLNGNKLTEIPPEIGRITSLRTLWIYRNKIVRLPSEISHLANLRMLRIGQNLLTELPIGIGHMTSLRTLSVDENKLTELPAGIGQLSNLKTLGVGSNRLTRLPSEISQLANLETLHLNKNRLTELPPGIGRLINIQALNAADNQLTGVPPEIGRLASLKTLSLNSNKLTGIPRKIGQLTSIKTLSINKNQLTALPEEIGQLTGLQTLSLAHNKLTRIPPEIGRLTSLQTLAIGDNQLTEIPVELADLLDNGLIIALDDNPLADPLAELLEQGARAVAVYLRSLQDGVAQYETKVLLVGEGNVGKTSLSAALRDEEFMEGRPFTHGIEIEPVMLQHPDTKIEMTIRVWDFGGQEVYRITHQFFFSPRALYLVVWKPREGQEQNEVEGWLRRIRLRVGVNARVLIVATHCAGDQRPDLDYPHLEQEFPQMLAGHLEVDNKTGQGIAELRNAIAVEAARLPQMGQMISSRWVQVRSNINNLAQTQPQMAFQDFAALCRHHGVGGAEVGTLAALMHDLGQIVYYGTDEGLQDFVVLNPEWLTKAISYVLRDDPTRQTGGVLVHSRLREIWQDRQDGAGYPARYHRYFLRLMEKFDISYRLEDQQHSLVAQLVPYQRPELPWDSRSPLSDRLRRLALVCQLSEPAPGLMAWLTVRHHHATTGRHWRNGVFLRHPIPVYDSEALLELSAPIRLIVEVRAPSPDLYFHVLSDSIETLIKSRWPGLSYQLLIPCPTLAADGSQCPQLIPIEDLLAYREEGEHRYFCGKCRARHDVSALLTGFPISGEPLATEMQQQLVRVENRLIRIEGQAADAAAIIRQILRVVSSEVTDCPTVFTLTSGNKSLQFHKHHYRLTLWCAHPGFWHPWDQASYEVDPPKEWFIKVRPYAGLIIKTLQLIVPLVGSIAVASQPSAQIESAAAHLDMMKTIVGDLPSHALEESEHLDPGQIEDQMTVAEGEALRALRLLIFEHDNSRKFGGLRRVQNPSGDFLWVCPNHFTEYDPGLPEVP